MIEITRIERQKKQAQRFALFQNDEFLLGVSEQTLIHFGIFNGMQLSRQKLNEIDRYEQDYKLKDRAIHLLARRPHSRSELKIKLLQRGFSKERIEKILLQLEKDNYLDDSAFAKAFVAEEIRLRHSGPLVIKAKLKQRGIENETIDTVLGELYSEDLRNENVRIVAEKKHKTLIKYPLKEQRAKLAAYLQQKGFSWQYAAEVIQTLISGDDNEEA